ncbi:MAG: 30S ribosomal protein S3 [Candidatus Nealsonbacteria bacterium]|nr:30S ribosomal protein S3 [Candidatus Nealsonbacteria bacterium]
MTHKVHPKAFRIRDIGDWDSRWISMKNTPQYLEEDLRIRDFLDKKLKEASIEKIEIERFPGKINIIISTARPGIVIGRGGEGIEMLIKYIKDKILKSDKKRILKIEIKGVKDPWIKAQLVAQWIAQQIEKRSRFRKVLKQAIGKVMVHKEAKGVRVQVSGRLDGKEIARREWLKEGRLPRQTLRADIDYGETAALCTYGKIGVKVWIYKGDKFD